MARFFYLAHHSNIFKRIIILPKVYMTKIDGPTQIGIDMIYMATLVRLTLYLRSLRGHIEHLFGCNLLFFVTLLLYLFIG